MKPTLSAILADLLASRIASNRVELSRGLNLQFKPATIQQPHDRLCCYRLEAEPSWRELAAVRRDLELLTATTAVLGDKFTFTGSDGRERVCFVFSWPPAHPPQQMELPLTGNGEPGFAAVRPPARQTYQEID